MEVLDIVITTNVDRDDAFKQIRDVCAPLFRPFPARPNSSKNLSIESFPTLSDPWLLPWGHKHLIAEQFLRAKVNYTHFIYVEDDVLLSFDNLCYFIHYREILNERRLIPSFQRIEYNDADNHLYLVDQVGVTDLSSKTRVDLDGYAFVNLDYPFNAMFILDRELALEYVETPSFDRQRSKLVRPEWDVACRAAMGLCFENPPAGFTARYVSPIDLSTLTTPSWSWVYHLPNNYAKDSSKPFAKTRTDQQFSSEANVGSWRPTSRVVSKTIEYLALMLGKKRYNGPDSSL
ncbi:hypothetical protein [Bradyrhizobium sp. 187]|uniref:hypothetical protein n=1 Tax=Bradyrhizobium sp. 187 TaxID=2782655 RepID=UPI001FFF17B6|nr:hypothetical protein [Bradyrhizobium sp. 187]